MKMSSVLATIRREVISIEGARPVRDAIALLAARAIGVLLVRDERGEVAGIVSERDIVRSLATPGFSVDRAVRDTSTGNIFTAHVDDDAAPVLERMLSGHFRHVPVTDGREIVCVASMADILRAQLLHASGRIDDLEGQLLGEQPGDASPPSPGSATLS